jgi:aryl-alcohol dehydrogenase-like predicted oxidoreductase
MAWLDGSELRIGLGCMRLLDDERGEEQALATIAAALDAGVTVFDTARAYAGNEALLARALRASAARVVTKGGMSRADGGWIPDGRARAIRADCEASLEALDGLPIDLYLLHTPDPRTPWRTSVRALARLVEEGLVRRVGVANVNRTQLDEALELAPIAAVQVALSVFDVGALRGGVVERCTAAGVAVIAHSPLGGVRRPARLARHETLAKVAAAHDGSFHFPRASWRFPARAGPRRHARPRRLRGSRSTPASSSCSPKRARRDGPRQMTAARSCS